MPAIPFEKVPEHESAEFGRSPPGRGGPPAAPLLPPGVDLPRNPPYKAFLRNLPHGVTVDAIHQFFSDLQVSQQLPHGLAVPVCAEQLERSGIQMCLLL